MGLKEPERDPREGGGQPGEYDPAESGGQCFLEAEWPGQVQYVLVNSYQAQILLFLHPFSWVMTIRLFIILL